MKKSQKKAIRALVEAQSRGQKELIYNSGTENELKITVVSAIPHTKRTAMIMEIVSLNFANEIVDVDSYMPTALELSRRYAVLKYYTDLKFPSDIDELWLILNHTSIYDDVVEFVGVDIAKIFDEADKMISAKVAYLTHKSDLNLFLSKMTAVVEKFGASMEGVDMTKMLSVLGNLSQFSSTDLVGAILENKEEGGEPSQAE